MPVEELIIQNIVKTQFVLKDRLIHPQKVGIVPLPPELVQRVHIVDGAVKDITYSIPALRQIDTQAGQ